MSIFDTRNLKTYSGTNCGIFEICHFVLIPGLYFSENGCSQKIKVFWDREVINTTNWFRFRRAGPFTMGQFDSISNQTHLYGEWMGVWVGIHLQELQMAATMGASTFIMFNKFSCMCMCMSRGLIYPQNPKGVANY